MQNLNNLTDDGDGEIGGFIGSLERGLALERIASRLPLIVSLSSAIFSAHWHQGSSLKGLFTNLFLHLKYHILD